MTPHTALRTRLPVICCSLALCEAQGSVGRALWNSGLLCQVSSSGLGALPAMICSHASSWRRNSSSVCSPDWGLATSCMKLCLASTAIITVQTVQVENNYALQVLHSEPCIADLWK